MGNGCPSRLAKGKSRQVDLQVRQTHRFLNSLPEGAWRVLLRFQNASLGMHLRTTSRAIASRVQAYGGVVGVGAIAPFLGETRTAQCLERFSELFPQLRTLFVQVFSHAPRHSVPTQLTSVVDESNEDIASLLALTKCMGSMHEHARHVDDDGDGIGLVMPHLTKLRNLRSLDLKFTVSDPAALEQVSSLTALRKLWLNGPISDQVLQAIGRNCSQLEVLDLNAKEHSGDAGLIAIATGCPLLRKVSLADLASSDQSIAQVLSRCSHVELTSVDVGSRTLDALAGNPSLKSFTCGDCANVPEKNLSNLVQSSRTLQNLTIWDCDTHLWLAPISGTIEPPGPSIRHLKMESQRFMCYQFEKLANWSQLETLDLMYFGLDGWTDRMLDDLIQASSSLQGLRRVYWASQMPQDKQAELVAGLSPCMLYVNGNLVSTAPSEAVLFEQLSVAEIRKDVDSDSSDDGLESSLAVGAAKLLHDPASVVICPQYVGADGEEPPTIVSPDSADRASTELWALGVELLAQEGSSQLAYNHNEDFGNECHLVLLTFGRFPTQMHDALLQTDIATSIISRGGDVCPSWANDNFVLADGVDENAVSEAREDWHVAVRETDEQQVYEALKRLPYNIRPRPKLGCRFPVPENATLFGDLTPQPGSDVSDDDESLSVDAASSSGVPHKVAVISIKRTFLHVPPYPMASLSPRTSQTA